MLVMPLTDARVGAKDLHQINPIQIGDQPVVDPGTVVDPPVVDPPVDTPTPAPTLPPVQQVPVDSPVLDDPVVLDPGSQVNDLYINPVLCPASLDLSAVDYYGLAANCNLGYANGWELIVMDSQSNWWIHNVINGSGVGQGGLPNDDYYMSFTHPASGFSPHRIVCQAHDQLGNDAVAPFDLVTDDYGGTVSVSGGLMWFCDAFIKVDGPAAAPIDVLINKHGCPQGIHSDDYYFLASMCQDMLTGINFTLTDGASQTYTQTTAGAPAMATFSQVTGGNVSVAESIPGGYDNPVVFCGVKDLLGNDLESSFRNPAVTNGAFILDSLPADTATVFCDVYNIPTDSDGGSIIIVKRFCPVDYDIQNGNPTSDCGQPQDGVQFNVTGPNGYASQSNTGDSISSAVSFGGLEAGEYQVAETLPAGVGSAWIWSCSSDTADLSGFAPADVTGSPFTYDLADNEDILCVWYNVPSSDGSVTIHKWECPADVQLGKSASYYLTTCATAMAGVEFGESKLGDTAQIVSTDASGTVTFSVGANVDWVIEEHVPSGYGDPIVFCKWGGYTTDQQGNPLAVDGISNLDGQSGASIQFPTYDTFGMNCDWFNVPQTHKDGGDLTIIKYWCAGYIVSDANCQLGSGVTFVVSATSGGSPVLTQTGYDGSVTLAGLEPGAYSVTEKDYEWCKATSSKIDGDGNVVIEKGQETVLTVYNCTPDSPKKEPPVKKFPNTGAGSTQPGGDDEIILLGALAVLAKLMVVIALRGKGVSLQTVAARISQ
jgi:hypothetical protein